MPQKARVTQRYASAGRAAKILTDLLKGKEHDRDSIAKLGSSGLATADRQIKVLTKCPGVVTEKRGKKKVLRFDVASLIPPPSFPEVIAACFGTGLARVFEGSAYELNMRNALAYLVKRARRKNAFAQIERKFLFVARGGEVAVAERSGLLDDMVDAVLHSKRVRVRYQRFHGGVETLDLEPLSIAIYDHQLYLVARGRDPAHPYRFARIQSLEDLHETFEYPELTSYNPDEVFHNSFGVFISDSYPVQVVKVRLAKRWATYARTHRWHRTQRTEAHANGTVTVQIRVRTCPELEMWVLGFGEDAEVLEPADFRNRIAMRIAAMGRAYPDTLQLELPLFGASTADRS